MIPKIAHFVWIGPEPIPETSHSNIDRFCNLNPGWSVKVVSGAEAQVLAAADELCRRAWAASTKMGPAAQAFVAGLMSLKIHGGCYIESDVFFLRSLNDLPQLSLDTLVARRNMSTPVPCVIGAAPQHEIINRFLAAVTETPSFTPGEIVEQVCSTKPIGLTLLPPHYFCPISTHSAALEFLRKTDDERIVEMQGRKRGFKDDQMPFGIHVWGSGYQTPEPFPFAYPTIFTPRPEPAKGPVDDGKTAGFFKKLGNAARAAGRAMKAVVTNEKLTVSKEEAERRLKVCQTSGDDGGRCKYYNGTSCAKCGCVVNFKRRLATETCPIGRWSIIGLLFLTKCVA